jgi:hypothetical protein
MSTGAVARKPRPYSPISPMGYTRLEDGMMFFRKQKPVVCAICGKRIEPKERRFVDKNRVTKAERHIHLGCRER